MRAKVQKWGNSLALRIPKSFAEDIQIQLGTSVELSTRDETLVVTPLRNIKYTLEGLLSGVNEQNIHEELDLGSSYGREAW
ncbi:MAG: AbrB/MazE/SpoVT family DNA-binding domain-containing protein [bacterium]